MRTSKTVGGVKHNYYYVEGKLMYEDCPSYRLYYAYDANGFLSGIRKIESGGLIEDFGVHCNIFGDVLTIYAEGGNVRANYTYDSWGKILSVTDAYGNDITGTDDICTHNSIRYRGYVYDEETQLYYLQSRYYDPNTCRFINADDYSVLTASPTALTDKNLFAYCDSNPIIRADDEGECWHIVAGAVIGGIGSFAATLVTGGSMQDALISLGFGVASGALTAAFPAFASLIGASFGAAESITIDLVNMDENNLTGGNIIANASISAVFGALSGLGDDYLSSKIFIDDIVDVSNVMKYTKKGNHPVVKKNANKIISKFVNKLFKEVRQAFFSFVGITASEYGVNEICNRVIK